MTQQTDIYLQLLRKFEVETQEERQPIDNDEESAKQISILSRAFLRHVAILRSFGNNPLYFTKVTHGKTDTTYVRFDYKIFSGLTLLALLLQLFYISGFVFLAYRLFNGDYRASSVPGTGTKAKHTSTNADGLVKAFLISFFLTCSGGCVSSFITSSKLAQFLNNWKDFVFNFPKIFNGKSVKFEKIEKVSKIYILPTPVLLFIYVFSSVFIYKTCIFNIYNNCTWIEREQSFIVVGFGCQSILNTSCEHVKIAVLVHAISHAFSQISDAMQASKMDLSNGTSNMRDLFNLIYGLREQTKLLMEIFETSLLFLLFFLFSLTIIIWMMLIQFTNGDVTISFVLGTASLGLVQFTRFAGLTTMSEGLAYRERVVLEEISNMKFHSVKAQIEIQLFIKLLTKRPSEFNLSNIITMRRSLFLALMSNSTTYLIAIQQLADVSNSDLVGVSSMSNSSLLS